GVWTVASQTRFGQVSLVRLIAAALLAASLPALNRTAVRSPWRAGAVVLAIIVLIGPAWTGHAGATPGVAGEFPLPADALHWPAPGSAVWRRLPCCSPPRGGGKSRAGPL